MKIWRRKEITVQATQQIVISKGERCVVAWCLSCRDHVAMVTAERAAALIGINSRAVYRLVESGALHFVDTSEGRLLVCVKSLSAMFEA